MSTWSYLPQNMIGGDDDDDEDDEGGVDDGDDMERNDDDRASRAAAAATRRRLEMQWDRRLFDRVQEKLDRAQSSQCGRLRPMYGLPGPNAMARDPV